MAEVEHDDSVMDQARQVMVEEHMHTVGCSREASWGLVFASVSAVAM